MKKNHANHEWSFNPDDDILVENVWFLLIVYTPLFIFFSLVYTSGNKNLLSFFKELTQSLRTMKGKG